MQSQVRETSNLFSTLGMMMMMMVVVVVVVMMMMVVVIVLIIRFKSWKRRTSRRTR